MWERSQNINLKIVAPPFHLSRMMHDEWTAWHKLWRNLGATEDQIQCPILLDVEARIHEEAEVIEGWSPSYPRSLQKVWIGNNEQSVGQIRIRYSKLIAEIPSSTHRAPWTRATMWTIQGNTAFENAQGRGGQPTATASHEYQKQRSAESGSAIDARSSEVGWVIAIFRRLQAIDAWNVWGRSG